MKREWWKEAVVYQIYPRSFNDTNNDGVGDLRGIIQKLDYIKSLGVDVVWLNPIYSSPNDDNGYDISDYRNIMKEFGTLDDFNILIKEMHQRGIKLVMDLVVNHSSDEHHWFQESRKSRDNKYRNYYHWWPAEDGQPPYRWSFFDEKGEAWQYDSLTDSYYLHLFSKKQPDLNWDNPDLRKEVYDIMKYWLDKGVDGFRMDVIPFISKELPFKAISEEKIEKDYGDWPHYYAKGPKLHQYLKEMNREVLSKYDIMTVGECAGVNIEDALKYVTPERQELQTFFQFDGMSIGLKQKDIYVIPDPEGWKLSELKKTYTKWNDVFAEKGWGSIYLGNHDQPRAVSRWGNDSKNYHKYSATLLQTFLLSMRSTPYIYSGDEIGMTNIRFDNIEDYRDLNTINMYNQIVNNNTNPDEFLQGQKEIGRDNGRTPFQWNSSKNAGFSTHKPWLKVNTNHKYINVEVQNNDPDSILNYFRRLIQLRKKNLIFVYGDYNLLDAANEKIYAYTRTLNDEKILVLLNFSEEEINYTLPEKGNTFDIMINNYNDITIENNTAHLKPYQSVIIKLKNAI